MSVTQFLETARSTSIATTSRRISTSARWSPSTPRRWASTRIATACASSSSPPATASPTSSSSCPTALGGHGYDAPNLARLLADPARVKLMHFARFDVAVLQQALGITVAPVRCTKIAAKLVRTFTDRHGLRDLCRELLGVEISKQQQSSDWGAPELSPEQLAYAASDVLHLHALWERLQALLQREHRLALAEACFDFLPARCQLDLLGYEVAGHLRPLRPHRRGASRLR